MKVKDYNPPKNKININHHQTMVTGVVTPIGWNTKGQAVKFSICTFDEEEDIIVGNSIYNKKLSLLLNKTVQATGKIYNNKNGDKCIHLTRVLLIKGPSSPASTTNTATYSWYEELPLNIPPELPSILRVNSSERLWEAC